MGVVTDTYIMNIQIIQHGLAKVVAGSVVCPTTVEPNAPFVIQYQVRNDGSIDTLWGHLLVGSTEIIGSAWTQPNISTSAIVPVTFNHPGISSATSISIEVGRP